MEYIRVADIADLPANKMITVVVKGQEVLLANIDGAYYAIANKCTHLGGSLSKGVLVLGGGNTSLVLASYTEHFKRVGSVCPRSRAIYAQPR